MREFKTRPRLADVKRWAEQEQHWDGRNRAQPMVVIHGDRFQLWHRVVALIVSAIALGVAIGLAGR